MNQTLCFINKKLTKEKLLTTKMTKSSHFNWQTKLKMNNCNNINNYINNIKRIQI